jgi:tRNA G18 (ribose-2'-O)-methylase SpoU
MRSIILIAHNLRSCHNVGSLLRTAEGLGVQEVILTGYTPYPLAKDDKRLPHIAKKIDTSIHKTALDAEKQIPWRHAENVFEIIEQLKNDGYTVAAVEQTPNSVKLPDYICPEKIALLMGREVEGVENDVLAACDLAVEISMFGRKESFNVSIAAAIALYHCRFINLQ